jgi:uncharacterized YigZ family protein
MTTPESYPIPAGPARTEIRVVNSRFIGSAEYTPTVDEAKAFIARVRAEFPDATHHAYAYLVGYGSSVTAGMSDAGEPSGTAGRPMLAVVRGSGLGDITVVVTRFFGGTLLGTGGLVHAYSDTTRAVLDILPQTERIEKNLLQVRVAYTHYTPIQNMLESYGAVLVNEEFAADVTLEVALPVSQCDPFVTELATLTSGQAQVIPVTSDER